MLSRFINSLNNKATFSLLIDSKFSNCAAVYNVKSEHKSGNNPRKSEAILKSRSIRSLFHPQAQNQRIWNYFNNNINYVGNLATEATLQKLGYNQFAKNPKLHAINDFISISKTVDSTFNLESSKHSDLIQNAVKELKTENVSFEQVLYFIIMLKRWPPSESAGVPHLKMLRMAIDSRCCELLDKLTVQQMFILSDSWFHLRLSRLIKYNRDMLKKLIDEKLSDLTQFEFVQMMFNINLMRKIYTQDLLKVENKFLKVMDELSMEELGIVSLGYFMTQSVYHDQNVLEKVVNKTSANLDTIDGFTLSNLLKSFRKSTSIHIGFSINSLFQKFTSAFNDHLERFDMYVCVNLCILGCHNQTYDQSVMNKALQKCSNEIEDLRLKDLCRLVFAVGLFNHTSSPNFIFTVKKEMRKRFFSTESERFPRGLITYLLSLTYLEIYETNLISEVFAENFLKNSIKQTKYDFLQDLFALDCNLQIECDNYRGNRLPIELVRAGRQSLEEKGLLLHEKSHVIKMIRNAHFILQRVLKNDQVIMKSRILPHYLQPDLFLCISPDGKIRTGVCTPKQLTPVKSNRWIAIVIGSRKSYMFRSKKCTGNFQAKCRQLKKLGYEVLVIPWYEYELLSDEIKIEYMKKKLRELNISLL